MTDNRRRRDGKQDRTRSAWEQDPQVRVTNFEEVCYGYSLEESAVGSFALPALP
ncbi:MAG: hypothetical protein ACLR8Y_22735 [Alistipes indistinctus]